VRYFPDKLSIGVLPDCRSIVFLCLLTDPLPHDVRAFVRRHTSVIVAEDSGRSFGYENRHVGGELERVRRAKRAFGAPRFLSLRRAWLLAGGRGQ
jgi:hypothetical protein